MPDKIEDLLHRRSDLSTFLVHLTKKGSDHLEPRNNLLRILSSGVLEARNAYGMGRDVAKANPTIEQTQRVVCFTETPLEHVWMLCRDIEERSENLSTYGLAFTKTWARRQSANPIMYLDITKGHDWLTVPINEMVAAALAGHAVTKDDGGDWQRATGASAPIFRITPFFEQMGNPSGTRKEFWWEREWRHVGDLHFEPQHVVAAFVPTEDHADFRADLSEQAQNEYGQESSKLRLLDPGWGLERMIAALAGVDDADVGPFPDPPS